MNQLDVSIEYLKAVNYALCHNGIAICQKLEIKNLSGRALHDLQVVCKGEYISTPEHTLIPVIKEGETIRLSSFKIVPTAAKLLELTERVQSEFSLSIHTEDEVLYQQNHDLELMPFDHWLGTSIQPQTLVSFVTPNHPSIGSVIVRSASLLKDLSGSSSFNGYQAGNVNDVKMQVAAIYAALHEMGIVYRVGPASYETVGQRVTMPDQVLATKLGNCIELTLLFASVLESVGINSGIILQRGHAYLAVWLVNECSVYSVIDDASLIEKKCARGLNEMMVLECTQLTQESTTFETAISLAEKNLADLSKFEMMIDVLRCRLEHYLPLPLRLNSDSKWVIDEAGVEHDRCLLDLKEHDPYDLSHLCDSNKELSKFDIWERKLLDFTLRNSLLNFHLGSRAVQFISFNVHKIEDRLQEGVEYSILSKPDVDLSAVGSDGLRRSKLVSSYEDLISNDIEAHTLRTYLTEGETQLVLKKIYRATRISVEETGANPLFLAIGVLRWYENPVSEMPRYAPLLLLPVDIVYKRGHYFIRTREEEIALNITLLEYLRQTLDIRFAGLDQLPKDESGVDVAKIFAIVRDALKSQKRWDVEEECVLGTFSFSKFLMWNDVHNNREQLLKNNVVSSLVANRLTWTPDPVQTNLKDIDSTISPADLALPVPVDSSQMSAVIEGGKGHSFILYGPPGTGKSQTITNLIANALYQGKRVLFVAEKMAALSVVQSRLAKIGLDPFCLELHSNKVTKRHVLEQLDMALKVAHIVPPSEFASTANRIYEERKTLIGYMKALHDKDPHDRLSLNDCIVNYEMIDAHPMEEFVFEEALDRLIATDGVKAVSELLANEFETVVKLVGQPSQHPLRGLHLTREILMSGNLTTRLTQDLQYLQTVEQKLDRLMQAQILRDELGVRNDPKLFETNGRELLDEWCSAKAKWFVPRFFAKRDFVSKMQQYNRFVIADEVDQILDKLVTYQQLHLEIGEVQKVVNSYFATAFGDDQLPDRASLLGYVQALNRWIKSAPLMREWIHWSEYSDKLKSQGLGCIVTAMEEREYVPSELRKSYLKALFRFKAEAKINMSQLLIAFNGMMFDDRVKAYKRFSEEFQSLTQKELYARLAARVPRVTDSVDSSSEIGFLNRNISNGGRGVSLRDLFDQIPTLMPHLCPCMLMSPMSVAQYINLDQDKFDLVVFDEASQMPTSEAVGAIARGKSLIVVGDPKQMPPTSFFATNSVDEDEAYIDDMESILEDCRTLELPSLQLNWHYRSKHESLIAFSNQEYYGGSLITFPSVDDQDTKVKYFPVSGCYDKGGKRSNESEADAIIQEIARRLKDEKLVRRSIGVIAFSVAQQGLIEDKLQDLLDNDREARDAADSMYEPIFVKNLENAQGDERDVILFSIGYGPDKSGKVSMVFGPLNNAGGERRLNVAVSRARYEMLVYSTLRASQIDLRRSKARGVEGLKHFLEYAESQYLANNDSASSQHLDAPMAELIAAELTVRGYQVKTGVGRSQFKVDIAICDRDNPNVYRLGVLLDGLAYRNTQTTRDREIVQPSVLSGLKWRVIRVWSVDWYNNHQRVLDRIIEAYETSPDEPEPEVRHFFDIQSEEIEPIQTAEVPYEKCEMDLLQAQKMSKKELLQKIVEVEQPITFGLACARVKELTGIPRVTPTLQGEVRSVVDKCFYTEADRDSVTIWMDEKSCRNYQSYRADPERTVADVPMAEICNVVRETIAEQIALPTENLTLIAAKKLGFTKRGPNVSAAFVEALEKLKSAGEIAETDGKLKMRV